MIDIEKGPAPFKSRVLAPAEVQALRNVALSLTVFHAHRS